MQSPPEPINPYAPTDQVSRERAGFETAGSNAIPNNRVTGRTIFAVACSGATFGFLSGGLVCSFAVISMLRFDRERSMEVLVMGGVFYLIVPALVGFLLAALAGVVVVPSMMWLFGDSETFGGPGWERSSIRLFAALCGTLSGWGSTVVFSWLTPMAFFIGLIPAAVGLIATPLFMRSLMREADRNSNTY